MYIFDSSGNKVKLIQNRYTEIPDVDAYIDDLEHVGCLTKKENFLTGFCLELGLKSSQTN